MRKLNILCDMDGIVVDLTKEWLRIYNSEWDDDLTHDEITDWNTALFTKPECGNKLYDILKRPGLFDHLPPHEGAIQAIEHLVGAGHNVTFATATPSPDAARGKIEWVLRQFAHLDFTMHNVVQIHDKVRLSGDILIDDKAQTIENWVHSGRIAMCIEHPYNQSVKHVAHVYAASYKNTGAAWKTILSAINKIANKE